MDNRGAEGRIQDPLPKEAPSFVRTVRVDSHLFRKQSNSSAGASRSDAVKSGDRNSREQLFGGILQQAISGTKELGGWRPVLDVSPQNKFVSKVKFAMETAASVLAGTRQGDWMVSIDLQDTYFHIPIHPDYRKYLRFVHRSKTYQFRALCFGLNTAPYVFTRVVSNVSRWLHLEGVRISMYLDDWIIRAKSQVKCLEDLQVTMTLTQQLGLLVNLDKSQLTPSQDIIYLGMRIQSVVFRAFPAPNRFLECLRKVKLFLGRWTCSAREWMSLLGTLSSIEQFVSLGRLHLRPLKFHLASYWMRDQDLETWIPIPRGIKDHLSWWDDPKKLQEGLELQQKNPDQVLYSDASDVGWSATLGKDEISGLWQDHKKEWHINMKELTAIHLALLHFQEEVKNKVVQVNADNTTALAYIKKQGGTRSDSLYEAAKDLLLWAKERNITLLTHFIEGEKNVRADLLSRERQVLTTEGTLHHEVCNRLWELWGEPTIDLFATQKTKRLPVYCSPIPDQEAVAVDAFLMDWERLNAYAFPPFKILDRVLKKFRELVNARMILIAPFWPTRPWITEVME
ncbi:uncharacterized protein LOC135216312 [Macrobrachium nipponense]|uniref:uncharacterized protein LOC135216312 n=1 Tax=Macrobrachium nipponense TaxID=159736 RepID=UPI0030C8C99C